MLALQDKCIHPTTQQAYVKSYGGGRDTSPEGLQVVAYPHPTPRDLIADSYVGCFYSRLRERVPECGRSEVLP